MDNTSLHLSESIIFCWKYYPFFFCYKYYHTLEQNVDESKIDFTSPLAMHGQAMASLAEREEVQKTTLAFRPRIILIQVK